MGMGKINWGGFVVKDVVGKYKNLIDDLVDLKLYCSFGKRMMMSY